MYSEIHLKLIYKLLSAWYFDLWIKSFNFYCQLKYDVEHAFILINYPVELQKKITKKYTLTSLILCWLKEFTSCWSTVSRTCQSSNKLVENSKTVCKNYNVHVIDRNAKIKVIHKYKELVCKKWHACQVLIKFYLL